MTVIIISQRHSFLSPLEPAEPEGQFGPSPGKRLRPEELYPSLILMVAYHSSHILKLKQELEAKGCQVYRLDPRPDALTKIRLNYFNLIVFDLTQPTAKNSILCQEPEAASDLANPPRVILATCDGNQEIINLSKKGLAYYLFNTPILFDQAYLETELWRFIEQFRCLTLRYS